MCEVEIVLSLPPDERDNIKEEILLLYKRSDAGEKYSDRSLQVLHSLSVCFYTLQVRRDGRG